MSRLRDNPKLDRDGNIKIGTRVPYTEWRELDDVLPWGLKQYILKALLRMLLNAIRVGGPTVAGAIVAGHYRLVPDNEANGVRSPDNPTGEQMQ